MKVPLNSLNHGDLFMHWGRGWAVKAKLGKAGYVHEKVGASGFVRVQCVDESTEEVVVLPGATEVERLS